MAKKKTKKTAPRKSPRKTQAPKPRKTQAPKKKVALSGDELLIEELAAARNELKRVAHEENAVRREVEASLSNERNASDRLRAELEAVRLDLKTALADLEIARAEAQRESSRSQVLARELAAALEGQRLAEHAATSTREELFELRRELERLRAGG
jgi:hypothetical protein